MATVPVPPSPVKAPATRRPKTRSLCVVEADPFGGGLVRITQDAAATVYRTMRLPADPEFGGAFTFRFVKLNPDHSMTGDVYDLAVSSDDPEAAVISCPCVGFTRWKKCRHEAALRVLLARFPH